MAAEIAGCCLQEGLSVRCSQGQAVGQMAENNGLILAPDLSGHWGCSDQTRYSLVSGVYQCSPEGSLIVGSACLGSILSLSPRLISIFWEVFGKCRVPGAARKCSFQGSGVETRNSLFLLID